jgi:hypothetical protein
MPPRADHCEQAMYDRQMEHFIDCIRRRRTPSSGLVRDFIRARFPQPRLRLSATAHRAFVLGLPEHDIAGGAAYDALVVATAAASGTELVTCDRPAATVYETYGFRTRFLALRAVAPPHRPHSAA